MQRIGDFYRLGDQQRHARTVRGRCGPDLIGDGFVDDRRQLPATHQGTHPPAKSSTAQRSKGAAAMSLPAEAGKLPMSLFVPTKR